MKDIKVGKEQMSTLPYIIAVDFDGTLVTDEFPNIGEPNTVLIAQLKELIETRPDLRFVLWTCRDNDTPEKRLDQAVDYLKNEHNLVFHAVNRNVDEVIEMFHNDTRKVYANEYIDDKAVEFDVPMSWVDKGNTAQLGMELEEDEWPEKEA